MNYGASLGVRMDDSIEEYVEYLESLGLSHVELRWNYLDTREDLPSHRFLRDLRESHDVTYTIHAPYNDCNPGSLNDGLRRAAVDCLVEALDVAAAIGAGAVVTHGGSVSRSYPDRVREYARDRAVRTIREAARHADEVGVPLCVENQRSKQSTRYNTSTPTDLAAFLDAVDVDTQYLGVTLDVGHAKASGIDHESFVETFGDRIVVTHLHDNDGDSDDHDPLPDYESVAADVGAPYNVLEMKSKADVRRCVERSKR
jgi:sugar phosphate isomerase/epimerase